MNADAPLPARALDHLTGDYDPWLSCDECFDLVDGVVDDFVRAGVWASQTFGAHLRGCPACLDEARALVVLVAEDDGMDATAVLDRFDRHVAGG